MLRKIAAIVQNPGYFHLAVRALAIEQKMPGSLHALALDMVSAEIEMVRANAGNCDVGSFFGANPFRLFHYIPECLHQKGAISRRCFHAEFILAPLHDVANISPCCWREDRFVRHSRGTRLSAKTSSLTSMM